MAIGLSLDEIKHHTLSDLSFYDDAEVLKDKKRDMWNWYLGAYVQEAMGVVLSNAFPKKGSKPVKYREKPFLQSAEMTQEERERKIKMLFAQLDVRKANFERTHGEK